jgi:hypothetical protein
MAKASCAGRLYKSRNQPAMARCHGVQLTSALATNANDCSNGAQNGAHDVPRHLRSLHPAAGGQSVSCDRRRLSLLQMPAMRTSIRTSSADVTTAHAPEPY